MHGYNFIFNVRLLFLFNVNDSNFSAYFASVFIVVVDVTGSQIDQIHLVPADVVNSASGTTTVML